MVSGSEYIANFMLCKFQKKLTPVDVFIQYISTAQTPTGVTLKQLI